MSASVTNVPSATTVLDSITFAEIREKLEARMASLGLDYESKPDWNEPIEAEFVDELVMDICNSSHGAFLLRALEDFTTCKMSQAEDTLPGIIDLNNTNKAELTRTLIATERLYRQLQERLDVLESNRGKLRGVLGQTMRNNGESEFKAADNAGHTLANIKLELKLRTNWPDKDLQFEFFEAIGQGDVIKPTIAWQTGEKVVDDFVHDGVVVQLTREPSIELFLEQRKLAAIVHRVPEEELVYAIVHSPDSGMSIVEYTGDAEFPFRPVCKLYQTVVAKVTKLY